MLIYLDSSDLINLCRGAAPINISDLGEKLAALSHQVVFSVETLIELAAPLKNGRTLEVRRNLNRLEEIPHTFVNEARIYVLEIREAISAFEEGREYDLDRAAVFSSRFDGAIDLYGRHQYIVEQGGRIPTKMIVNFRMSEQILYLWKSDRRIFDVQRRREPDWIHAIEADRTLANPPRLCDHFVTTMIRALATHRIRPPASGTEPLARWIYESPSRCPGVRLTYETQHRLRRDRKAKPHASDIIDLARVASVPYVDFFIADAAMMTYCIQAAKEIGHSYPQVFGNLEAVLSRLGI